MLTSTGTCPECSQALVTVGDRPPWCGACEWNLDAFVADGGGWFGRRMDLLDRRAGFRADRALAGRDEKAVGRRVTAGRLMLLAVSLVLWLGLLADTQQRRAEFLPVLRQLSIREV